MVVEVKGRMDAVTAPEFEQNLSETISKGEKKIIINLSGLEYISSAGLRSILVVAKKLKAEQGTLFFYGLQGTVQEVFKISGFFSIFRIVDSLEAALSQF